MGVRRALDAVLEARRRYTGVIYTYGPLIHNPQVLEVLARNNIRPLEPGAAPGSPVVIRAHGITPEERKELKERGFVLVDATCPRVAQVQALAKRAAGQGKTVVILGDRDHAEVKGILGFCRSKGFVIEKESDLSMLDHVEEGVLLFQTTLNREYADRMTESIRRKVPAIIVQDTLCEATDQRQAEARSLAHQCDAVIVVGGKSSANTARLVQVIEEEKCAAIHVETEEDLPGDVKRYANIGITAGASTPYWLVHRVEEKVREIQLSEWMKPIWMIFSFLVRSYLLNGLGAFGIAWAMGKLLGMGTGTFPLLAALYIFGIHVVNGYGLEHSMEINEPMQKIFLARYRKVLLPAAFLATLTLLILASQFSHLLLFLTSLAVLLGALYPLPIPFLPFKLKDLPASKDLFTSAAWAFFSVLLPAWMTHTLTLDSWIATLCIFSLLFSRALLYDIKDLQGDRMLGRETIPVILGRRGGQIFSIGMILVGTILIFFLPAPCLILLVLPCHALLVHYLYHAGFITGGVRFSLVVDGLLPFLPLLLTFQAM